MLIFIINGFFFYFLNEKNYFCTLKLLFDWFFFVVSLFSTRTERNYVSDLKKKMLGKKVKTEKKKLIGVEMFEIKKILNEMETILRK